MFGIDLAFSYNQDILPMNCQCQMSFKRCGNCHSLLSLHLQHLVLSLLATQARWELATGHLHHSINEQVPVTGTADSCQIPRDWPRHSYFSSVKSSCICKGCCREQLVHTEKGSCCCPEPIVGLGGCRWAKKSYTQFGCGETGDPNVRLISNHLCVGNKKGPESPLFLTKIALFLWWKHRETWHTLAVKATWQAQNQCFFPP